MNNAGNGSVTELGECEVFPEPAEVISIQANSLPAKSRAAEETH